MRNEKKAQVQDLTEVTALRARVAELEALAANRVQAEEMLRGLLEAAPDAIVVVNGDGRMCLVNSQTEKLFGYTRDELLGQPLEILLPERFRRTHQAYRTGYFTNSHVRPMGAGFDLYGLRKDGVEIPVEVSLSPLETAEGLVVTSAIRDITERKRTEEALREEAAIAAALARVGQGLIASLETPTILERLCQLTTESLECDCSYIALWHPEERAYKAVAACGNTPEQWEAIRALHVPRLAAPGLIARLEQEGMTEVTREDSPQLLPQGLLRQFGMTAVLYLALWRGTELIGIQSAAYRGRTEFSSRQKRIAHGISQLASLALANARLLEELEYANRIKEDFIGTMSHELRTPLNVIIGYTGLFLEGEFGVLSSEQINILRRIDKNSRELLDLVVATLDLSRLQSQQASVHRKEVNVTDLLTELETDTRHLHDKPAVNLQWRMPQEILMLHTDPVKLKMVLKNLVTNALKFTQEGSVTVAARLQDDGVEFSVMDTGMGIAPEDQQSIFDPFHQLDSSSTRRHGGVGLGLYIVRQLLPLLGGSISVESKVAKGSTFRVWIPQRP